MSELHFEHESLPQRVCFASGEARAMLARVVARLKGSRVMVIASARDADRATQITADLPVVHRHTEVAMHVPVQTAKRARAAAGEHDVDVLVCLGGGSAIGLAKAIALTTGIPIVAVPTTYAGSEATTVWGLTEDGHKTTGVDPRVLPWAVIYDAELTMSLPVPMSVASGLNAVAHCMDSMWGPRADPIDRAVAQEGIRALSIGLPQIVADPGGLGGREQVLYGAYLAGVAFSSAGSGLHHKICHVLGGTYNLPHAQTHAVVLPYVLAFNTPAAPEAANRIATALGSTDALDGLQELRQRLGAPKALRDYGFDASNIDAAGAAILSVVPNNNPRPVTTGDLHRLLYGAWQGTDPTTITYDTESRR
ncbi:maleylacetate reductase [Antrihabitans stalagmiti]|uniref:maleylacetate reductase n=1 Tax=Antrihabitans stalagmiti TaxID=2799499 RepID=UPI0027DD632C|nr:maleylacetate reductase [Antrihabitans stalagmiti]